METKRARTPAKALSVVVPGVWNSLPLKVRLTLSLPVFGQDLKTEHFKCTFKLLVLEGSF